MYLSIGMSLYCPVSLVPPLSLPLFVQVCYSAFINRLFAFTLPPHCSLESIYLFAGTLSLYVLSFTPSFHASLVCPWLLFSPFKPSTSDHLTTWSSMFSKSIFLAIDMSHSCLISLIPSSRFPCLSVFFYAFINNLLVFIHLSHVPLNPYIYPSAATLSRYFSVFSVVLRLSLILFV